MKLQPCPFCGGKNPTIESCGIVYESPGKDNTVKEVYSVFCPRCACRGPQSINKDKAIKLWNREGEK